MATRNETDAALLRVAGGDARDAGRAAEATVRRAAALAAFAAERCGMTPRFETDLKRSAERFEEAAEGFARDCEAMAAAAEAQTDGEREDEE